MKLYYPLTIDLYNLWPFPVMMAQQGNVGRGAAVTLVASGQVIRIEGETVSFYAKRPDGSISYLPCTVSGTTIHCDFTNQMLAKVGHVQVELQMIGGTAESPTEITTPIFIVDVQPSNINDGAIESQNEFTALQEALAQVSGAVSGADAAAEAATEAAGVAGDAATAANQATQAANTAAGNANDAAGAAGGAATAANQAAQAANTAAGSANSAASAANQAAQAASTAIADLKPIATSGKASDVAIDTISGMTATDVQTALSQLNSKMQGAFISQDPSIRITRYTWSGNAVGGQMVKLGEFTPPDGATTVFGVFLSPKANMPMYMTRYGYSIYVYSNEYSGNFEYDVLVVWK